MRKTFAGFSSNSNNNSSSTNDGSGGLNAGETPINDGSSLEGSTSAGGGGGGSSKQQPGLVAGFLNSNNINNNNNNNALSDMHPLSSAWSGSATTIGPTGVAGLVVDTLTDDRLFLSPYQASLTHGTASLNARQCFEKGGRSVSFADFRILDTHVMHQRQYLSKMLRLEYSTHKSMTGPTGSAPLVRKQSMKKDVTESLENLERKDMRAQSWKATKSPIPVSGMEHRGSLSGPSSSAGESPSKGEGSGSGVGGDLLNVRPVSAREKLGLFMRRGQKGNRPSHSCKLSK